MAWNMLKSSVGKRTDRGDIESENSKEMRSLKESRPESSGPDWDYSEDRETEEFNRAKARKRLSDSVPGTDSIRINELRESEELDRKFPSDVDQQSANSKINKLYKKWMSMEEAGGDEDEMDALMMKIEALKKIRKAEGNDPFDLQKKQVEMRRPKHERPAGEH